MQQRSDAVSPTHESQANSDCLHIDWIASYPRSGNTWTRFLLTYGVFGESTNDWNTDVNRACVDAHYWVPGLRGHTDHAAALEVEHRMACDLREKVTHLRKHWPHGDQHFILKTHFKHCPEHPLLPYSRRAIYLIRHPLLVARSSHAYYTMLGIESRPLAEYLEEFIDAGGDPRMIAQGFGTWEENRRTWLATEGVEVLEVRFEDLRTDTQSQLTKILEFLRFEVPSERVRMATHLASKRRLAEMEDAARSDGNFRAGQHEVSDQGRTINQGSVDVTYQIPKRALERFRKDWVRAMDEAGYAMP